MSAASQLKREIGLFSAIAIVVANMVGTGIFTTSGFILQEVGSSSALLLGWLVGGAFALCGALCYGELGARYPQAGGEYVYLREAFGKPVAFLSGWISLIVGFSAPIAAAAIAFSVYLLKAVGADADRVVTLFGVPAVTFSLPMVLAIAVVALLSILHAHSLRVGSRVQNLLTLFKIALIVTFIGAGMFSSGGSTDHISEGLSLGVLLDGKFAVALIFISFAYSGWNAAAYLGGEIQRPSRNIPLAMLAGTLIVTALYLLLNLVYVYALPPEDMSGVMEVAAAAGTGLFGPGIGRWLNGAISLGLLSVISAMILAGPRVYYAMSRDGIFFPLFGRVSSARHTPAPAIGLQAAIAIIMIISASYDKLLVYIGFTLSLFAMLTVVGLIRVRRAGTDEAPAYRTWGYPLTPLFFILGNLWIIVFSIKSRPAPVVWGIITIAAGLGMYLYFHRGRLQPREKKASNPPVVRTLLSDRGEIEMNPSKPKEDLS
ncbi:amino acid permease [Desulfosarcina alkanivorans]|uniref:Amino acid permease n=1 Tax=Desulfosarcina alkanivorans TaxID=571177 RepID=A0A5K7YP81_9BACT|nr:amino acid permease [Desulfosarcina alkanivorans]BBO71592.1 amino acid permease [Desulfosarcina alkanivorans]